MSKPAKKAATNKPAAKVFVKGKRVRALSGDWGHGNHGEVLEVKNGEHLVQMDSGQKATFRANALTDA